MRKKKKKQPEEKSGPKFVKRKAELMERRRKGRDELSERLKKRRKSIVSLEGCGRRRGLSETKWLSRLKGPD